MMNKNTGAADILDFWFEEIDRALWFRKSDEFDQLIIDRFSGVHAQANACELYHWRASAEGRLAEIIVLDQFSRNMFRGSARSFTSDSLALALAQEAVAQGADRQLRDTQRTFMYMPYMHSESAAIHEDALRLYEQNGLASNLDYEIRHKRIIDRFGRYPHRNEVLGRESTEQELEFLSQPGSSF